MSSRLFWKILLAFWMTFFCVVPAIWIPLATSTGGRVPPDERLERMVGHAASARGSASAAPVATQHLWDIILSSWQVLLVGGIAGLLFSVLLARYLATPVEILQSGFNRLAHGDFDVRLADRIGDRRDEIANLARDFDAMARHLDSLVNARDRLLHDVSHELRSPLSRLQLAIGLLRQNPKRDELIDRIEHEAHRLSSLVGEVLALARAESSDTQSDCYYDPLAIIAAVVEDASFEAEASGVAILVLSTALPGDCQLTVQGNGELFVRAIENVVRNAVHHSPAGSDIILRLSIETGPPAQLHIAIEDKGSGVEESALEGILDPFRRAGGNGFGLGLSIARRAIIAQKGTIRINNHEGGGLHVLMSLPLISDIRPE